MTRRQIVTTLIFIIALIGAGSVGAAASQKPAVEERGAIQGVVTRAGTTDPHREGRKPGQVDSRGTRQYSKRGTDHHSLTREDV